MPVKEFCGYEMIRLIGRGGMAVVWEARKKALNKRVAIKILRSEYAEDEDFAKRFEREAMNSAKMEHPNIVLVTDYGRCEGTPFIEMEYLEGADLAKLLKDSGTLPIEIAILILRDVCSALAHAHAPGREVVHRDIKPSNVMFTPEGVVKLMDFGLARARLDDMSLTTSGLVMGTVPYMAPEQAAGQGTSKLSDIFSMGVMSYELLRGERPFQGESPSAVTRAIQEITPPRLDEMNPLIPEPVATIVQRMLEKLPERRCQDIREVERALEDGIEKLGIVHERRWLRDFANDPAGTTATLRRRRIQRHLDQGLYFEKLGAGKIEDAMIEFQRVLVLDPQNDVARKHLAELREVSDETLPYPKAPPSGESGGRRATMLWAGVAGATAVIAVAGFVIARQLLSSTARPSPPHDVVAAGTRGGRSGPSGGRTLADSSSTGSRTGSRQPGIAYAPGDSAPSTTRTAAGTQGRATTHDRARALPEAAIADSCDVAINLHPSASLWVDGRRRSSDQSSYLVRLPVGPHRIRAEHARYDSKEWSLALTRHGAQLDWDFEQSAGKIVVSSLSDCWAWIRVDGEDTGQHTPATISYRSGPHRVEVFKQGLTIPEATRVVIVQQGQRSQASFDVPCPR